MTRPRALDLYSGIGGWTLGLAMAGIDVVASYEWWDQAIQTHELNFGSPVYQKDIRGLDPSEIPTGVDFVVGSPPCTQFSFSNRGGNGDIDDGLKDIRKFLEIVETTSPTFWAMENVPRVATILERELGVGGGLRKFRHLVDQITVVDMADYGLPQRRRRMLAGSFPLPLLESYKSRAEDKTLGDVLDALTNDPVIDPLYATRLPLMALTENQPEPALTREEARMNREAKEFHPVYNVMKFPDPRSRTARTVTALCTRVSRESIIIRDGRKLRRLSVRERASLQGFPITFQFEGKSVAAKIKMVGNAVPPLMTYYLANAMQETPVSDLLTLSQNRYQHQPVGSATAKSASEKPIGRFPAKRVFRAAVPNLRFGSGTRFELVNVFPSQGVPRWRVDFYFGSSKAFRRVALDREMLTRLREISNDGLDDLLHEINVWSVKNSSEDLQAVWTHRQKGTHPFEIVDGLGDYAARVHSLLGGHLLNRDVLELIDAQELGLSGRSKLIRNAQWILAGLLAGTCFNCARHAMEPDLFT